MYHDTTAVLPLSSTYGGHASVVQQLIISSYINIVLCIIQMQQGLCRVFENNVYTLTVDLYAGCHNPGNLLRAAELPPVKGLF